MDSEKLSFLDDNQSVASTVSLLHDYFKNAYSHQKVKRSQLLSHLETAIGEEEQQVLKALREAETNLSLFGVLNDALSIADRLLHTRSVVESLGRDAEIFTIHHETEAEQQRERTMRKREPSL